MDFWNRTVLIWLTFGKGKIISHSPYAPLQQSPTKGIKEKKKRVTERTGEKEKQGEKIREKQREKREKQRKVRKKEKKRERKR